jgi:alkyl hydroperoxide reductase subunit AhpC
MFAVNNTQYNASFMNSLIHHTFDAVAVIQRDKYCRHMEYTEQEIGRRSIYGMGYC